jgi:large subunit ribosomal protein L7/L12
MPTEVILNHPGSKKIQIIKVIRDHTSTGLKEAKDLVDSVPSTLATGMDRENANAFLQDLLDAGAQAEVQ